MFGKLGIHGSFSLRLAAICASVLVWTPCFSQSQSQTLPDEKLSAAPTTLRLTNETWKLPADETMGMVGGTLLFNYSERVKMGLGTYGAVSGVRGGFITIGLAAELNQRIIDNWHAEAGLFVGGGGGRGGASLAGGGLMVRSNVGINYDAKGLGKFGFGLSHVNFPSGVIQSTQPYIQYDYTFPSLVVPGWRTAPAGIQTLDQTETPLLARPQEFSLIYLNYRLADSVEQTTGQSSMKLMGVEWLSYLDDRWFIKYEMEGAMGGGHNGYMQILAGGGYRLPLNSSTAIKMHLTAGPAGGGSVDTGGGLLIDTGIALQKKISRSTAVELYAGEVRTPAASFSAHSLAVKLTHQFVIPSAANQASWAALDNFEPQALRIRTVNQTYLKGDTNWRSSNVDTNVDNIGIQLDYFIPSTKDSTRFFLTGQGVGAYGGGAGAYMTGLVGAGVQVPVTTDWFVEAEGLVGAAGGGGLAVGTGLVSQVNTGIGYRLSNALSLIGSVGYMTAFDGDFKAKVVGLTMAYQFTGFTAR